MLCPDCSELLATNQTPHTAKDCIRNLKRIICLHEGLIAQMYERNKVEGVQSIARTREDTGRFVSEPIK
jgi:hypothetical protein